MRSLFLFLLASTMSFNLRAQPESRLQITPDISLVRLTDKVYVHVSMFEFPSYGKVYSNGLVVIDGDAAWLFDTPVTEEQTRDLCLYVEEAFGTTIKGFVPTHWHGDCLGGIGWLHGHGVMSYAFEMTKQLAKENGIIPPEFPFEEEFVIFLSNTEIVCRYPGPAHSMDNIVIWLPEEKILFAGCLSKDMASQDMGNTADGDIEAWPGTVLRVMEYFPDAEIVVPGHGEPGGMELLERTYEMSMGYRKASGK